VAIQGSTETFPVRGLLAFLGDTSRTGRLVVQAKPQVGLVALREGRVVAAGIGPGDAPPPVLTAPDVDALGDLLLELVTLPGGRFAFHPDGVSGTAVGFEVAAVLAAVDERLGGLGDELDPAHADLVQLEREPAFDAVTVTDEHWELLIAIGDGASVADLSARTGLGQPAVRRRLSALTGLGLVAGEAVAVGTPPARRSSRGGRRR
jgi:DNA-binding transcriptional ArsR family regulator